MSTPNPFATSYLTPATLAPLAPFPAAPPVRRVINLTLDPALHGYRTPTSILRGEFALTRTSPSYLRFRTRLHEFFEQYQEDMIIQERLHVRNKARMVQLLGLWEFHIGDVEGLAVGGVVKRGEEGWEEARERREEVGYLTRAAAVWALVETVRVAWRRGRV